MRSCVTCTVHLILVGWSAREILQKLWWDNNWVLEWVPMALCCFFKSEEELIMIRQTQKAAYMRKVICIQNFSPKPWMKSIHRKLKRGVKLNITMHEAGWLWAGLIWLKIKNDSGSSWTQKLISLFRKTEKTFDKSGELSDFCSRIRLWSKHRVPPSYLEIKPKMWLL